MEILFGGKRCKGMGTTIGIVLLVLLVLSLIGGGVYSYFLIVNSENKIYQEEAE